MHPRGIEPLVPSPEPAVLSIKLRVLIRLETLLSTVHIKDGELCVRRVIYHCYCGRAMLAPTSNLFLYDK